MRRLVLPGLVALLVLAIGALPSTSAKGGDPLAKAEAKQRARIAKVYLDLARYLVGRDLKVRAQAALDRARALDPEARDLDRLAAAVEALVGQGTVDASTESRITKAKKDAARGYDKLAGVFAQERDDPRFATHLIEAIALDPSAKRLARFGDAAKEGLLLVRSPTHPMAAHVSFPKAWRVGGTWPALVCVDGAGAGFVGCGRKFANQRGKRPFLVVSPHALSCTNAIDPRKFPAYGPTLVDEWTGKRAAFDVPGLLAILDFLHEHFGVEREVAITGFSGGGNLCYGFLLRHPDRVFCAVPACANFQAGLAVGAQTPEDGGPPVHLLTGANDPHRHLTHGRTPPGIEEQTDGAQQALRENGFGKVKRTMLDGVGHSACVREVWSFVDDARVR